MIHIVQWLCHQRHCLLAVAFDPNEQTYEAALEKLKAVIPELKIEPVCFPCKSADLHYEDGVTRFATMDEAFPHLQRAVQAMWNTRKILGSMKN